MARQTLIQVRKDNEDAWVAAQTATTAAILATGEIGYVISGGANNNNVGRFKIGDGTTLWGALTYAADASKISGTTLSASVTSATGITSIGTLGSLSVTGTTTSGSFSGSGTGITSLNGSNISTGTVPVSNGGTGATSTADVRTAFGIGQNYLPFVSGAYYRPAYAASTGGTNIGAINTLYLFPFYVGVKTTFKNIGVTASVTAGGNIRIGVYSDSNGTPSSKMYDSGNIAITTTASAAVWSPATTPSIVLDAGWYWVGAASYLPSISSAAFFCHTNNITSGAQQRTTTPPNIPYTSYMCYGTVTANSALPDPVSGFTAGSGVVGPVVWLQAN
jgi:hypothetical protein